MIFMQQPEPASPVVAASDGAWDFAALGWSDGAVEDRSGKIGGMG